MATGGAVPGAEREVVGGEVNTAGPTRRRRAGLGWRNTVVTAVPWGRLGQERGREWKPEREQTGPRQVSLPTPQLRASPSPSPYPRPSH